MTATPKSFIRNDGQVIVAEDFYTTGGKKLSDLGESAQSPLNGNHKTIANNTDTPIFTFPLAAGEGVGLGLSISVVAKKGADWAVGSFLLPIAFYNDGGTLHTSPISNGTDQSTGSMISEDIQSNTANVTINHLANPTAVLNSGVVTVSVNPGNVGTTPDSIDIHFAINNPHGKVITFL